MTDWSKARGPKVPVTFEIQAFGNGESMLGAVVQGIAGQLRDKALAAGWTFEEFTAAEQAVSTVENPEGFTINATLTKAGTKPEPCPDCGAGVISPAHGKCTSCNRNFIDRLPSTPAYAELRGTWATIENDRIARTAADGGRSLLERALGWVYFAQGHVDPHGPNIDNINALIAELEIAVGKS